MTTTATEYILGPLAQIPVGEGRVFDISGLRIAVFHTRGGAVYATQASCPHRGGPLADGLIGGSTLVCPLHAWKFDLATGAALFGDCELATYPARLNEDGDLALTLAEE
ncbi:MAG: Rieske 2Fe-2S domain-containing protein [Roseiflexaceae bacterium]